MPRNSNFFVEDVRYSGGAERGVDNSVDDSSKPPFSSMSSVVDVDAVESRLCLSAIVSIFIVCAPRVSGNAVSGDARDVVSDGHSEYILEYHVPKRYMSGRHSTVLKRTKPVRTVDLSKRRDVRVRRIGRLEYTCIFGLRSQLTTFLSRLAGAIGGRHAKALDRVRDAFRASMSGSTDGGVMPIGLGLPGAHPSSRMQRWYHLIVAWRSKPADACAGAESWITLHRLPFLCDEAASGFRGSYHPLTLPPPHGVLASYPQGSRIKITPCNVVATQLR